MARMARVLAVAGADADAGKAAEPTPDCATRGPAVMRAMDCACCHGRDYRGWSAPSLVAAVRDGSRERFDRYVLEGDIVCGMPGYRSQPLAVAEIDAIYEYLRSLGGQPAHVPCREGTG